MRPVRRPLTGTSSDGYWDDESWDDDDFVEVFGAPRSQLGALNAAHASPNALANAAPNSRVGRIAAYRDDVLEGQALQAEYDHAVEHLATLPEPDRSVREITLDLRANRDARAFTEAHIADLQYQLDLAGGSDPILEAQIDAAEQELQLRNIEIARLRQERADAIVQVDALNTVSALGDDLVLQPLTERDALQAAANKPVTDQVELAVRQLRGLY